MLGRIVEDIFFILLGANSHKWLRYDDGDGIPNTYRPTTATALSGRAAGSNTGNTDF